MTGGSWPARCRERLLPLLDGIRGALERYLSPDSSAAPPHDEPADLVPSEQRSAFDVLVEAFGLGPFEISVLLLCAGVELDSRIAALCARAHAEPRRRYATFGLALSALPGAHWSATAPTSALRQWNLVQLDPGDGLADRALRIDERVLHYLGGLSYLDAALEGVVKPCAPAAGLSATQADAARRTATIVRSEAERGRSPIVHLLGSRRADRIAIACAACQQLGLALHTLRSVDLPSDARQRDDLARRWAREAVLGRSALVVECEAGESPATRQAASGFLEAAHGVVLLSGGEPPELRARRVVALEACLPSPAEQRALWAAALPGTVASEAIERLVAQFPLSPDAIDELAARARAATPNDVAAFLWDAARRRARPALGALAQLIEPRADWDLLVLPPAQRATLRDLGVQVRQRQRVYETWGFGARSSRGLGISALFAGPSGTGKTMAAEVLARELELDLLHVDLGSVVSKYIGETEKNLSRIFDSADGSILLFDEADALFGRRSEVKDSHDRYANIEVSYLLQRMESYRGLAILTTNLEGSLDPAFMRRIRFVVRFPYPEPEQRAEIWRRIFPEETPTDGLDLERLGRLDVPGGNIRNIALQAAFLAAEGQSAVTMRHLAEAARSELRKLGQVPPERELRGWV